MAIVRCADCGKKVSTQAASCPSCGCPEFARPRKRSKIVTYGGGFLAVCVVAASALSSSRSSQSKMDSAAYQTVETIKRASRDPGSFQVETFLISSDLETRCIRYRAKNGFGGISVESVVVTREGMLREAYNWHSKCSGEMTDVTSAVR